MMNAMCAIQHFAALVSTRDNMYWRNLTEKKGINNCLKGFWP